VEDGVSGLLVEPRDADALAGAMTRLAEDAGLLDRLRAGAVAASERFRSTTWTDRFAAHCLALAEGREPPA
jgi:glycosyltransferase involved in cell wall biosynthesis